MTEKDILKQPERDVVQYFKCLIPAIISFIIFYSTQLIDGYFVSRYVGANALASLNIVSPMISCILAFALMLVTGGMVRYNRCLGGNRIKRSNAIFTQTFIVIAVFGIICSTINILFTENVVKFLNAKGELIYYSKIYLKTLSFALTFQLLNLTFIMFIKSAKHLKFVVSMILANTVLNIFFNYIFVVICGFGMFGSAISTVICMSIGFVIFVTKTIKDKTLAIKFSPALGSFKEMFFSLYNGGSNFILAVSIAITTITINKLLIHTIGIDGVAAYSAIDYTTFIAIIIFFGISDSTIQLISASYGAKDYNRMHKYLFYSILLTLTLSITFFVFASIWPEKLISIFLKRADANVINIASQVLHYYRFAFLINGVNIVCIAFFTAIQESYKGIIIALSRSLICPLTFLYSFTKYIGYKGIFCAVPVAECCTLVISGIFFFNYRRLQKSINFGK